MRYFEYTVNTTVENIEKNAKVRLKDYDYDSTVGAVNKYFYKNMISNAQSFIYRAEGECIKGMFSYHEDKLSFDDALTEIENTFNEIASCMLVINCYDEVTTYQYIDCLIEARRHGYAISHNYLNDANQFIYDYVMDTDNNFRNSFLLEEKLVSSKERSANIMYDQSMQDEISNIKSHINESDFSGNMMHYVLSSRSLDAAIDMADVLLSNLFFANRITGRRVEVIREIDVNMYKKTNHLEDIVASNLGGAIIIDMTEKFGEDPVGYLYNCKYIEKLVKKYRNESLFIFAYNIDNPGFSYTLLPMVKKHVAMLKIREATGSKEDAILYLEELIKASQYSQYACQAGEFMEKSKAEKFSQSDVIEIFERFEPWCVHRNIFNAYNYDPDEDVMLDRDSEEELCSVRLEKLIGLKSVKEQINKVIINDIVEKERKSRVDNSYKPSSMHMIFGGNPGSAKTTVAKLFAGIAKERGILKSGAFVDRAGTDYCRIDGAFCMLRDFEAAKGGVLFIDEAYAITSDTIITVLLKEMENKRDDVIVILAGYNDRMLEFLNLNEGLKSRIPNWIDFPDYSTDELVEIFKLMAAERKFTLDEEVINKARIIFDKARLLENFGNGRYVRNLIEKTIRNQSSRLMEEYKTAQNVPQKALFELSKEDVADAEDCSCETEETQTAQRELDDMIGIASAKETIKKAIASFKLKKRYVDMGLRKDRPSMHMVFTGNPGTAKTTTARLVAEILRDEKVLPSGKFVEVGRADLIGQHVGETAPLVKKRFREAQGGVLFIDEAYSLCDAKGGSFGDEAISTIVQEMENHRDDVIVIFAGYPNEMKEFLDRNPGMNSRIAFHICFEDYSTNELCEIAKLMLKKKGMRITDEAMDKLCEACDIARTEQDYGNGRFVRKLIEETEMNLAQRLLGLNEAELDVERITTIEAADIVLPKPKQKISASIGFRVS